MPTFGESTIYDLGNNNNMNIRDKKDPFDSRAWYIKGKQKKKRTQSNKLTFSVIPNAAASSPILLLVHFQGIKLGALIFNLGKKLNNILKSLLVLNKESYVLII